MHNILSNIAPSPSPNLPYITSPSRPSHGLYGNNENIARTPSAGFTLLQGHIQLMAMVPTLPENEVTPRCMDRQTKNEMYRRVGQNNSRLERLSPITPRMMPSVSDYKKPHATASAPISNQTTSANYIQYSSTPSWQPSSPRSLSNLSLPPKPTQPIAMPSFGRHLPGTKRMSESGLCHYSTNSSPTFSNSTVAPHIFPCTRAPSITSMPSPRSQPHPQQQQQHRAYYNTCSYTNSSSNNAFPPYTNMAYQMMNFVPQQQPQQQQQQQPHFEYFLSNNNNGSGDHSNMTPILLQFQQQQPQKQQIPATYETPYDPFSTNTTTNNNGIYYPHHPQMVPVNLQPQYQSHPHVYHQSIPYAAQSLPCFGSSYNNIPPVITQTSMSESMPDFRASVPPPAQHQNAMLSPTIQLPPLPQDQLLRLPSLPKIRNSATATLRPSQSKLLSMGKNEVSILVESGSSEEDNAIECDAHFLLEQQYNQDNRIAPVVTRTSLPRLISPRESKTEVLPKHSHHQQCDRSKIQGGKSLDDSFSTLGPESVPTRIPSKPRVVHSPSPPPIPAKSCEKKQEEACTTCKRCMSKLEDRQKASSPPPPRQTQSMTKHTHHHETEERPMKKKQPLLNGLYTPRRKQKSVVLSVHECFRSDSSLSDGEYSEPLDTPRKSFNNGIAANNSCTAMRKKKPRMDSILHKARVKHGQQSEVFDVLHDLNPDEARRFTCDYLIDLLSSSDWSECFLGLETMVRLARHRPNTLLNYLGPILWYAFKHLQSGKSALCRAAIFTFTELFQRIGSAMDSDLEKLTEKLVIKSLAPNMFIREECTKALEAMVNHCSLVRVLQAMESVSKKSHVRAACHIIAKMTKQFVKVAGVDTCLKPAYAEKILPMLFSFMTEANNETRTAAKEALGMLMNHLQFEAAVTKHVSFDRNCSEVFKKLDKMRGRKRNRGNFAKAYPSGHFKK